MTSTPDINRHDDPDTERDASKEPEADKDPVATEGDPASNMDYEGDTPH